MNILEREIAAREAKITRKEGLNLEIEARLAEVEKLKAEEVAIDVETLRAEIEEIKTFLPKPVEAVEEEVAEEPIVQ